MNHKSCQKCADSLGLMYANLNLSSLSTANLSPLNGEKRGIFRENSPQTLLELSEEGEKIHYKSRSTQMHRLNASLWFTGFEIFFFEKSKFSNKTSAARQSLIATSCDDT